MFLCNLFQIVSKMSALMFDIRFSLLVQGQVTPI